MIVVLFVEWKLQHHLWETELLLKSDYDFNLLLIYVYFCVRFFLLSPTDKMNTDCCSVFHLNLVTVTVI